MTGCAMAACAAMLVLSNAPAAAPPQRTIPVDESLTIPLQSLYYGWSRAVACEGDLTVTGSAPGLNGLVVYRRSGDEWLLVQILTAPGISGSLVDLRMQDGRIAALTSQAIHIFKHVGESFAFEQKLSKPAGDLWRAMDFDGTRIAVTSKSNEVRVKTFTQAVDGLWIEEGSWLLAPSTALEEAELDLDGDRLAVGQSLTEALYPVTAGFVHIARRSVETGAYEPVQTITAPAPERGLRFGAAVQWNGSELFVGAPARSDGLGGRRGIVHRFLQQSDGTCSFVESISSPEPQGFEEFGTTLWAEGDHLVVGTRPLGPCVTAPRAWSFVRSSDGTWVAGAAVQSVTFEPGDEVAWRSIACNGSSLVIGEHIEASTQSTSNLLLVDRLFDCDSNGMDDALEIAAGAQDCDRNRRPDGCDAGSILVDPGCTLDCDGDGVPDWQEILLGLDGDCDLDDVPDSCAIASGRLPDLDGNGVPDDCDPDCDGNGVPDTIDLAASPGADCNGNGVPDACPHYWSGVPPEEALTWGSGIPGQYDYVISQRFVSQPGREAIHRIDFVLGGLYTDASCDTTGTPVRVALFRELSVPGTLPIDAVPVWFVDTVSGPHAWWSSISVPGVVAAEAGAAFQLVLIRKKNGSCFGLFGGSDYCDTAPSEGCGQSWFNILPAGDELPLDGVLATAFSNPGTPCMRVWGAPCPGTDLDRDGRVDGDDLGMLLGEWGVNPGSSADFNDDGVVDGADLGILLAAWSFGP